ncbi:MAG: glutamine--fructose-6-phosphate transaminase (isomerizing) [Phycisphaerae bacterium]|jgi:glucosamine--fructose-6-phosphate aminotransferase (isomerizing)|nr:glutamine--fructose-6-phosphate transaminase (isomerizing) [Phycisphaerae bacterium]
MCGIVGYIGSKTASGILLEGLKRLEYRGYDSAGLAIINDGGLVIEKAVGRILNLEKKVGPIFGSATVGIAHTRWATHGAPTETNAHPHLDHSGKIALVHNGIIENYASLRKYLEAQGVGFESETDTEVLAKLIGHFYTGDNLEQAVRSALSEVQGTYGIAVICADQPDRIIAARKGSPLIVGIGKNEYIVASDASAIIEHTNQVIYLSDGEMAIVSREGFRTITLDAVPVTKDVQQVEWKLEQIELGGFEHFMLKEIFEQPESVRMCMRGRVNLREGTIHLGGIANYARELTRAHRFVFTACGTAWHAGLVGEYLFEDLARIPTETEYASEFRYRNPVLDDGTVICAISQSGETADTLAALREARDKGALGIGIVNTVGSTIARETDAGVYLHVGPEIGVASTKAFTGQVTVLAMLAAFLGRRKHLSPANFQNFICALDQIPGQIEKVLEQSGEIRRVAEKLAGRENWLYLGRGYNYPVALEGALKIKEISYVHAEGMPAAEMKHGPIALVNKGMPAVFIATHSSQYDKILGNIEEVKARGATTVAVITEGDSEICRQCDFCFTVPKTIEPLEPLLTIIPLQLLAYHVAVLRGCNIDKPRNLAKSVTVE